MFNSAEVIPEFTADVGTKRGEKIDYAIVHDGQVQVLVEAKKINDPLRIEHASQLFRYSYVSVPGGSTTQPEQPQPQSAVEADDAERVVTTEEEFEGFRIVRAIVCAEVPAARVTARDTTVRPPEPAQSTSAW